MDNKQIRMLKKLYHHTNYNYDREREVSIYNTETLTAAEQELLHASGWVANDLQYIRHDEIMGRLIELRSNVRFDLVQHWQCFCCRGGGKLAPRHIHAGQLSRHDSCTPPHLRGTRMASGLQGLWLQPQP